MESRSRKSIQNKAVSTDMSKSSKISKVKAYR